MDHDTPVNDEARIRQRAYEIWLDEGAPSGRSEANWLQAKAEIERAMKAPASQQLDTTDPTDDRTQVATRRHRKPA